MGTFMGHFLPGAFFTFFALWWCVKTFQAFYLATASKRRYRASITYPWSCCCGRLKTYQMDGVLMIFLATVGITGEVITGITPTGFHMGNAQHITMFFAYSLYGVATILRHHKLPMVSEGLVHACAIIATIVEGTLFNYHLHGRNDLDKHVHYLLVYTIIGCTASLVMERILLHSPVATFARIFCFMLQGTWFIQVGGILYRPFSSAHLDVSKEGVGESIMIVTLYFAWHMLGIMITMGLIGTAVYLCCRKSIGSLTDDHDGYEQARNPLLYAKENGTKHHPISDTESEVDEFSQV